MNFKTIYNSILDENQYYTDSGSPIKEEYQLRVIDNDHLDLVKTGESDLYEYIQSHADSVDIHKILERCAMIDDYSMLNRMPATFMDTSNMPTNLAEAYAAVTDAKNYFDVMPVEIKDKYNNNFIEFLNSLGTEKFDNIAGEFLESIKPVEKEVFANES